MQNIVSTVDTLTDGCINITIITAINPFTANAVKDLHFAILV